MKSEYCGAAAHPAATDPESVVEQWRDDTLHRVVIFSQGLRDDLRVEPERLLDQMSMEMAGAGVLGGAMRVMKVNADQLLLVIGAYIAGDDFRPPDSEPLRRDLAALAELDLVAHPGPGEPPGTCTGLTRQGRQFAVFALYRILTAAAVRQPDPSDP